MKIYAISVIIAIAVHILVVMLLGVSWDNNQVEAFKVPKHVNASLVVLPKKIEPKPVIKNNDAARIKAAAEKKKQDEARRKAEAEKKKEQQRIAEEKARLEAAKKAQEKADREKAEKERLEQARKAEELRKKEEARLQAEKEALEGNLLEGLEEEDQAFEDAQATQSQDEADAATYYQLIERQISQNWSRPPSARNGMTVGMQIHLLPNGELNDVFIIQSSGDPAMDLSAERAVRKVNRFQVPKEIRLFEKYFRTIEFGFRPEDLRQ